MTKYILHGGFTSTDNELNRTFYEEFTRDVPDKGTVLLCYFASKDEDNMKRYYEDIEKIKQQSHNKEFNFLMANEKDFIAQLDQSDALYIRGGSTPKLLNVLNKFTNLKDKLSGKTVAGSSAGAYAIGKYSAFHDDDASGKVREGLGLLPLRLVCHYESTILPPNPTALELLKSTATELDLVTLRDFEWKVLEYNTPMKNIYLTSTFTNEWNLQFNPKIGEALIKSGITCHLPRKNINNERTEGEVFIEDIDGINNSSIILAIGLNESPNWGAEIGYAFGIKKPILILTNKTHSVPIICKGMATEILQVDDLDNIEEYIELLSEKIKALISA